MEIGVYRRLGGALLFLALLVPSSGAAQPSYLLFESGPVRPIAISPNGSRLFVANTPDKHLEIFDVAGDGSLTPAASVQVGLEPVALAARSARLDVGPKPSVRQREHRRGGDAESSGHSHPAHRRRAQRHRLYRPGRRRRLRRRRTSIRQVSNVPTSTCTTPPTSATLSKPTPSR
jgi:hypothetical protein